MKRVLVVGMMDSVHLARWLGQFRDTNIEITLFPSSRFRALHPDIRALIVSNGFALACFRFMKSGRLLGYLDFLRFELIKNQRSRYLARVLNSNEFDYVHLVEIQHAGYVFLGSQPKSTRSYKIITTNYGSDIFYFQSIDEDRQKISQLLSMSDFYSAECVRDYDLARDLGFQGTWLPVLPNSGGFHEELLSSPLLPLARRKLIYLKGYGGHFGLGGIALAVADRLLCRFPHISVFVGSLTKDLEGTGKALQKNYPDRVFLANAQNRLSHTKMLGILSQSMVVIGASKSDGISTTFLEALVCGAVPIQTDTSCASEWISKGFFGLVVKPTEDEIFKAACLILENPSLHQGKVMQNAALARQFLAFEEIRQKALSFYF